MLWTLLRIFLNSLHILDCIFPCINGFIYRQVDKILLPVVGWALLHTAATIPGAASDTGTEPMWVSVLSYSSWNSVSLFSYASSKLHLLILSRFINKQLCILRYYGSLFLYVLKVYIFLFMFSQFIKICLFYSHNTRKFCSFVFSQFIKFRSVLSHSSWKTCLFFWLQ